MGRRELPSTVIGREIQYLSPSSLTLGDPETDEGCPRKFHYEKVQRIKPPQSYAQGVGVQLHAEIERYLRGEPDALGPLAARGKHMIMAPGPDLMIEHDIVVRPEVELEARAAEGKGDPQAAKVLRATASLSTAPLRVLNIPVVGYIDAFHSRGTNQGGCEILETVDPENTVEVIDWKTTANPDYIKAPESMARTLQMTVYGKWVTTVFPRTSYVRLSHGYFVTKGSALPRKVTLRVTPQQIDAQWSRIERVAGCLVEVAREQDPSKVPANTRACSAFGGCPHRAYCTAGAQESLVHFFGRAGADNMLRRMQMAVPAIKEPLPYKQASLFGAPKDNAPLRGAMIAVAREEIEVKYPGLPAVWDELQACNLGHPQFTGELARVIGELCGEMHITSLLGTGDLASSGPFSDPSELAGLLAEVKEFLMKPQDATPKTAYSTTDTTSVVQLLPPDAPESDPSSASNGATTSTAVTKRGRGRPRKDLQAVPVVDVAEQRPQPVPVAATSAAPVYGPNLVFYVNCRPSCRHESFWPFVHELLRELAAAAGDAADFRLVPNDHKFAYGRWRAAIAAALRDTALPQGHYVLDNAGGEVAMAVAEAMRDIVSTRGGIFVQ